MSTDTLTQLKRDCELARVYRGRTTYCDEVAWYTAYMARKYPDTNWQAYSRIVAGKPGKGDYDIEVKHMIKWGKSDARIIEDAFQIKLPNWVHAFYNYITEAVFFWRKSYHFLTPTDVVALERELRQLGECEDLPVHLITFCKTESDYIAFRFNPRKEEWSIFYHTVDDDLEEIQSSENDETHVASQIDQLLDLLIKQDGLIETNDRCFLQRVEIL